MTEATRRTLFSILPLVFALTVACQTTRQAGTSQAAHRFVAPGEFEPQEFIWLMWNETGFLGGPPFSDTLLELMHVLTPHVEVRLMYSDWPGYVEKQLKMSPMTPNQAESRLRERLLSAGIDLERVELFHWDMPYGAIQDPVPFFLRGPDDQLAVADYGYSHPNPAVEAMDREIAARHGLPTLRSEIVSEGGARQSNGKGTLMLVDSVEFDRNPGKSREQIEAEHRRIHGASKVIWLKHGPREEDWGKLSDGRWGIGTGGHIDEFARFADAHTILLAEVSQEERASSPILRETYERMEANFAILKNAVDQEGRPFRLLRIPVPELVTRQIDYDDLKQDERYWFEGALPGERMEFYLPGSYLNLIIANDVVVTSKYWREGEPEAMKHKDTMALEALKMAFPGRTVAQVDATPMLYDGAGIHCWSRNQPYAVGEPNGPTSSGRLRRR